MKDAHAQVRGVYLFEVLVQSVIYFSLQFVLSTPLQLFLGSVTEVLTMRVCYNARDVNSV